MKFLIILWTLLLISCNSSRVQKVDLLEELEDRPLVFEVNNNYIIEITEQDYRKALRVASIEINDTTSCSIISRKISPCTNNYVILLKQMDDCNSNCLIDKIENECCYLMFLTIIKAIEQGIVRVKKRNTNEYLKKVSIKEEHSRNMFTGLIFMSVFSEKGELLITNELSH